MFVWGCFDLLSAVFAFGVFDYGFCFGFGWVVTCSGYLVGCFLFVRLVLVWFSAVCVVRLLYVVFYVFTVGLYLVMFVLRYIGFGWDWFLVFFWLFYCTQLLLCFVMIVCFTLLFCCLSCELLVNSVAYFCSFEFCYCWFYLVFCFRAGCLVLLCFVLLGLVCVVFWVVL